MSDRPPAGGPTEPPSTSALSAVPPAQAVTGRGTDPPSSAPGAPAAIDFGPALHLEVAISDVDPVSLATEVLGRGRAGDLCCERDAVEATLCALGTGSAHRWAFAGLDEGRLWVAEAPTSLVIAGFDVSAHLGLVQLNALATSDQARALGALVPAVTVEALCVAADGAVIVQRLAHDDPFFPGHHAPFVCAPLGPPPLSTATPARRAPRPDAPGSEHSVPADPHKDRRNGSHPARPVSSKPPTAGTASLAPLARRVIGAAHPAVPLTDIALGHIVYVPEANEVCVTAWVLTPLPAVEACAAVTSHLVALDCPTQVTPALELLLASAPPCPQTVPPPLELQPLPGYAPRPRLRELVATTRSVGG